MNKPAILLGTLLSTASCAAPQTKPMENPARFETINRLDGNDLFPKNPTAEEAHAEFEKKILEIRVLGKELNALTEQFAEIIEQMETETNSPKTDETDGNIDKK